MEMAAIYTPEGHIAWNWLLFAVGVAAITFGASRLTDSAVALARKLHVPKIIIGGTIVSLITTLPEFAVSFSAAIKGHGDIALGNAIGSTICNLGLILGICVVVGTVTIRRKFFLVQGAFMLSAGAVIAALALTGFLSRWGASILLLGLAAYIFWNIRTSLRHGFDLQGGPEGEKNGPGRSPQKKSTSVAAQLAVFAVGGILVTAGATLLVGNSVRIARESGIPELVIAVTLVALGTSLPELAMAIAAFVKGHGELSVGNVIGANVLNIFWVLGAVGMVREIKIQEQTLRLDMPFMLALMLLVVLVGARSNRMGRFSGMIMVALYAAYLVLTFTFYA